MSRFPYSAAQITDAVLAEKHPRGWHEDQIDPNVSYGPDDPIPRIALEDFAPYDLRDYLAKIAVRWNITLPDQSLQLL